MLSFDDPRAAAADRLRLEALADPALPSRGRAERRTAISCSAKSRSLPRRSTPPTEAAPVKLVRATADFVAGSIFPRQRDRRQSRPPAGRFTARQVERQSHGDFQLRATRRAGRRARAGRCGSSRILARITRSANFVSAFGEAIDDSRPADERRRAQLERKFAAWVAENAATSVRWQTLTPSAANSETPLLTVLDDGSVLASGDKTKRDVYDLSFDQAPSLDGT